MLSFCKISVFNNFNSPNKNNKNIIILFDFLENVFIINLQKGFDMKFLSSLKAWKKRGDIKQIRRGKQIILIDPSKPKLKAKQGFKKK